MVVCETENCATEPNWNSVKNSNENKKKIKRKKSGLNIKVKTKRYILLKLKIFILRLHFHFFYRFCSTKSLSKNMQLRWYKSEVLEKRIWQRKRKKNHWFFLCRFFRKIVHIYSEKKSVCWFFVFYFCFYCLYSFAGCSLNLYAV